jgi:hypothetical protein
VIFTSPATTNFAPVGAAIPTPTLPPETTSWSVPTVNPFELKVAVPPEQFVEVPLNAA